LKVSLLCLFIIYIFPCFHFDRFAAQAPTWWSNVSGKSSSVARGNELSAWSWRRAEFIICGKTTLGSVLVRTMYLSLRQNGLLLNSSLCLLENRLHTDGCLHSIVSGLECQRSAAACRGPCPWSRFAGSCTADAGQIGTALLWMQGGGLRRGGVWTWVVLWYFHTVM
jgi:hypothetical protein